MKKILIFDLQFQNYVYHSTPQPSMYSMLVAGYHKAKGDKVIFTDTEPKVFNEYNIVYINKDEEDLFHKPAWLKYPNVKLIGGHWENGIETHYDPEWEIYPPDITIYHGWIDRRLKKYTKYNPERLVHFYYTPVKIKQKNKLTAPNGEKLLIIDNDIENFDSDFSHIACNVSADKIKFLYPISLDNEPEKVLSFFNTTNNSISKDNLWFELKEIPTEEKQKELFDAIKKYKLRGKSRLKLNLSRDTNEEWIETIPRVMEFMGQARIQIRERIVFYPRNQYKFKYSRVLQEMKRWSGSRLSYEKNTCLDYILVDGCRNSSNVMDFLNNPVKYIADKRQGTNKLFEIFDCMLEYPDVIYALTAPYVGRVRM